MAGGAEAPDTLDQAEPAAPATADLVPEAAVTAPFHWVAPTPVPEGDPPTAATNRSEPAVVLPATPVPAVFVAAVFLADPEAPERWSPVDVGRDGSALRRTGTADGATVPGARATWIGLAMPLVNHFGPL